MICSTGQVSAQIAPFTRLSVLIKRAAALLCGLFVSGCAVTTSFDDGQISQRSVGFVAAQARACAEASTLTRTQIFGFGIGRTGAVLGYEDDELICLPLESCSAVFVVRSTQEVEAIRKLLPDLDTGCLINSHQTSTQRKDTT